MKKPVRLLNKDFSLLLEGQLLSHIGFQGFSIALIFLIKHLTDSATLLGIALMLSSIPIIIFGPLGGLLCDRYPRKNILILSYFSNGFVLIVISGIVFFFPEKINLILFSIITASVLVEIANSFIRTLISAAIPDIIPKKEISRANSLHHSSFHISLFIGQAFGGVLFRILGAPVIFFINGIIYLFSSLIGKFINIPQKISKRNHKSNVSLFKKLSKEMKEGIKFVWTNPGMRMFFLFIYITNFFLWPILLLLPFYVEDFLKLTTDWYGFILSSFGLGAFLGCLIMGLMKIPKKIRGRLITILILIVAIGWGSLGLIKYPLLVLFVIFFVGIADSMFIILYVTIFQEKTSGEIRGRVFGILDLMIKGLSAIPMVLAGIIADLLNHNISLIYITCGIALTILTLIFYMNKNLRNFLSN